MRAALSLVALLTACASAPHVGGPLDPAALRAGNGRVALRIESSGATQGVTVVPAGTLAAQNASVDAWCQTPCTLHLAPGEHTLWTGAPSVMNAVTSVRLGARPMVLRVRAPSRATWERGRNLLVGGVGLAVVGGIFVAFSPLEITGGSPTGPETIAVGASLAAVGAALIVFGLRTMGSEPSGGRRAPRGRGPLTISRVRQRREDPSTAPSVGGASCAPTSRPSRPVSSRVPSPRRPTLNTTRSRARARRWSTTRLRGAQPTAP